MTRTSWGSRSSRRSTSALLLLVLLTSWWVSCPVRQLCALPTDMSHRALLTCQRVQASTSALCVGYQALYPFLTNNEYGPLFPVIMGTWAAATAVGALGLFKYAVGSAVHAVKART